MTEGVRDGSKPSLGSTLRESPPQSRMLVAAQPHRVQHTCMQGTCMPALSTTGGSKLQQTCLTPYHCYLCRDAAAIRWHVGPVAGCRPAHTFQHAVVRMLPHQYVLCLVQLRDISLRMMPVWHRDAAMCADAPGLFFPYRGSSMVTAYEYLKRVCALPNEAAASED